MITKEEFRDNYDSFVQYMRDEEKTDNTISKYILGLRTFKAYAESRHWGNAHKNVILEYKKYLEHKYEISTANLYISALNSYMKFLGKPDLCVRAFNIQDRRCNIENSLTMSDYIAMSNVAKKQKNTDMYYIMMALVGLGIRIGELKFLTVEALKNKGCSISNKGKTRFVVMSENLCAILAEYCSSKGIRDGYVFFARSPEKAIARTTVSRRIKKIALLAGVDESKAFPHSFRHLFAKRYMEKVGNITGLMNILGHANIKTTMVYTNTTNDEKRKDMDKLGFY